MPELSRFLGMVVRMYYDEHPPPHFHVDYGEHRAVLSIDTLDVLRGHLPHRALALLAEWALQHRVEIRANWARVERGEPVHQIAPLE
jgi:hypothetical protein